MKKNKLLIVIILILTLAGCQSKESTSTSPYSDNQEIDIRLANFSYESVTLSFDLNENSEYYKIQYDDNDDGSPDRTVMIKAGERMVIPDMPKVDSDQLFLGWIDVSTNKLFDFYEPLNKDVYLIPKLFTIDYNFINVSINSSIPIHFIADDNSQPVNAYSFYSYFNEDVEVFTTKLKEVGSTLPDPEIIGVYKVQNGVLSTADDLLLVANVDSDNDDFNTKATFSAKAYTAYFVIVSPYQNNIHYNGEAKLNVSGNTGLSLGIVESPEFSPSVISNQTITVTKGAEYPVIPTSSTGHYFAGWYDNPNGSGEQFSFNSLISEDITLYATWGEDEVVLHKSAGGLLDISNIPSMEYSLYANNDFSIPPWSTSSFVGWFTEPEGEGIQITDNSGSGVFDWNNTLPETIFPYFNTTLINVYIYDNDVLFDTLLIQYGRQINISDVTKNGYNIELYHDEQLTDEFDLLHSIYEEQNLYSKHNAIQYNITYELDGGIFESSEISIFDVESNTISLSIPTRDGYNFNGWYTEETFDNPISSIEKGTFGNMDLYANWVQDAVEVTLEYRDGVTSNRTVNMSFGSEYRFHTPVREGYIFEGWYLIEDNEEYLLYYDVNGWERKSEKLVRSVSHSVYAKWTLGSSELEFDLIEKDHNESTWEITGLDSNDVVNLIIPSEYMGYKIEAIVDGAFSDLSSLVSISVPFVGQSEFAENEYAHFGYIFGTASYAGSYSANSNYTETFYNDGGYYRGNDILYYLPSGLTEVIITDTTRIGKGAFSGVSSLETMTIPFVGDSITDTESEYNYFGYIFGDYSYPNSYYDFWGSCLPEGLTEVIIADETIIGSGAFWGASRLTSIVIPKGVTSIGSNAFNEATALSAIIFEEGSQLTNIGDLAFQKASSLLSIDIPNGVTSIGDYAFDQASNLTSIYIPNSVTSIGVYAFKGTSNLTNITGLEENAEYSLLEGVLFNKDQTTLIKYPSGNKERTIYNIPEGVTSIATYAFEDASSLRKVVIPNTVTSIGGHAFKDASSISSIIIPASVTSIEYGAFYTGTRTDIYAEANSEPYGWVNGWVRFISSVDWGYEN